MRGIVGNSFVVLGAFAAVCLPIVRAAAELPPEILADRHLIQAEQLHADGDHAGALSVMNEIIAMQREHNFKLSDEFHFKYARVAMSADSIRVALDAANRYLSTAGRNGEFYREALALSLSAEETLDVPEIGPSETCTGKQLGSSCWMALANHPDCYVWNPFFQRDATASWSGMCYGGVGRGEGTINWTFTSNRGLGSLWDKANRTEWGRPKEHMYGGLTETGRIKKGWRHGEWVLRLPDGATLQGSYVRGKRHGLWVERDSSGSETYVARIPYSAGKRNGVIEVEVVECANSSTRHPFEITIRGEFIRGKKHGQWKNEWENGLYASGRYEHGTRQGEWEIRGVSCAEVKSNYTSGWDWNDYKTGQYLDGKKQGKWKENSGSYMSEGTYEKGKKHGRWREGYNYDFETGPYVEGKRHGYWVEEDGRHHSRGTYADGERNGVWYYWDSDERKCRSREYYLGSETGKRKKVKKKFCRE